MIRKAYEYFVKWHQRILLIIPILFMILGLFKFEVGKEAYFYTLSTVAQSLAALIGIIAIFIIFKLEKLKSQRKEDLIILKNMMKKYYDLEGLRKITEPPYSRLINLALIDSEEELFDMVVPILKEINAIEENLQVAIFKVVIKNLNKKVKHIIENIEKDKQIRKDFNLPLTTGLIAISFSILILPFGWIVTPFAIDFNSNSLKMYFIGVIIYLALLSIFQIILLLDDILELEIFDREIIEEKGIKSLFKYP